MILERVDLFQQLLAAKHLGHIVMSRYGLEMCGVDAEAVPALVVYLGGAGEETDQVMIRVPVNKPEPSTTAHDGVPSWVRCQLPLPALGPWVGDRALQDVIPSVVSFGRVDNEVVRVTTE